jgi:hypothetical protein
MSYDKQSGFGTPSSSHIYSDAKTASYGTDPSQFGHQVPNSSYPPPPPPPGMGSPPGYPVGSLGDMVPPPTSALRQFFSNPAPILMNMLLFAAGGALYGGMHNVAQKRHINYVLTPNPECFALDESMADYLADLDTYRKLNTTAEGLYTRLMRQIDNVFRLEISLRKTMSGPQWGDRERAVAYVTAVCATLLEFREVTPEPQVRVPLHKLLYDIRARIYEHLQAIWKRTQILYLYAPPLNATVILPEIPVPPQVPNSPAPDGTTAAAAASIPAPQTVTRRGTPNS